MKLPLVVPILALAGLGAISPARTQAQANRPSQTFHTSAGPVKITPLYHATMLIEAGGKDIYVDPAKPANFTGLPKADLILITDIHGDHMDPDSIAASAARPAPRSSPRPRCVEDRHRLPKPMANGEIETWRRVDHRSHAHVQPQARPRAGQALPR